MRNIIKKAVRLLPHLVIMLSGLFVILLIADYYNEAMNFLNNKGFKILLFILSISSVLTSANLIAFQRYSERKHSHNTKT